MSAVNLSIPNFLRATFLRLPEGAFPWVTGFRCDPYHPSARWGGFPVTGKIPDIIEPAANCYMAVSSFKPGDDGAIHRRKANFAGLHLLMVDDVGTKVRPDVISLDPSYLLETSPGNYQAGYLLAEPVTDRALAEAVINAMVAQGLATDGIDPGMKGVTRYARLPVGINNKPALVAEHGQPFKVRLAEWEPERRYTLDEIISAYQLKLGRARPASPAPPSPLHSSADPLLAWLTERGQIKGPANPEGWIPISCPWLDEHTGRADTGAAYLPPSGFKCHHGHCESRTIHDLRAWAKGLGWAREETPDIDPARAARCGIGTEPTPSRAHERFTNDPSYTSHSSQSTNYDDSTIHQSFTESAQSFTESAQSFADFSELPVVDLTTERKRGKETVREAVIESVAAAALARALKDRLAFCREAKVWHRFTGTHWRPVDAAVPDELVTSMLYAGTVPCGFKANYGAAVLTLLRKGLLPLPETASKPSRLIPFLNGLLNPETRELTPIEPDNALTWTLPYQFDANADCPTIKDWLRRVLDDDDASIEFIRAWLAALLVGRPDLQKFLHLLGPGNSGKGTLIRLAQALVGAHNTMPTDLRNLEQSRFETASLYGKRLVAITDTSRYGGSVDTLKALTGQDAIRLERKHKDPGSFTYDGMVIIASNEPLHFTDYSGAVERRRLTVLFNRTATDDDRAIWDAKGGESAVLHAEIPGLVNWCLALNREQVTRLLTKDRPERVTEANDEALLATNPIAAWMHECTESAPLAEAKVGIKRASIRNGREVYEFADEWLYPNYLTWCQGCNVTPESLRRFSDLVVSIAPALKMVVSKLPRKSTGTFLEGLRLPAAKQPGFAWSEVNPSLSEGSVKD